MGNTMLDYNYDLLVCVFCMFLCFFFSLNKRRITYGLVFAAKLYFAQLFYTKITSVKL